MKNEFSTANTVRNTFLARVVDMPGMRGWRKAWMRTKKRAEKRNFKRYLNQVELGVA
jgi:hypothetical protein